MTARRRLLAMLAAGALALVGLAGCRSDPAVAAYVGATQITEAQVTQILDDARRKLNEEQAKAAQRPTPGASPEAQLPINRQDVVVALVGREVFKAAAERRQLSPRPIPAEDLARDLRLPADAEYVKIFGEFLGYRAALTERIEPKAPSETDLRDIFARVQAAGAVAPGTTFEAWRSGLPSQDLQTISNVVGLRDFVIAETKASDVAVNPRYNAELKLLEIAGPEGRHPVMVVRLGTRPVSPVAGSTR